MGSQWGRDRTYLRAVREGYRSRAAYKLQEIQDRYHLIRDHDNVLDLGAAPGSWLQVARGLTDGRLAGIDLSPIAPLEGVTTLVADLTDHDLREKVRSLLGTVNVVISDAAPKLSGHRSYDQARAIGLGEEVLAFACDVLKPGGNLILKSFQGEDFSTLLEEVRQYFFSVKTFKCQASRKGSSEIYIIARNFVGYRSETEGPL
ncbi:MAG: Ribosomal RNA large subunit methyltransferase E [Methanoregulaceae archaeon PtaU1.Bin059]|nr:MAG: Ribosomal RNA large subunit methyltransferase E [Methanoregulaceae archaeon PtaB.Bin152]OPY38148.1 MAG: Ribosomal RNA large subunit methyltransferase E [Methanoregulaceae archaeon PtaU1.Bin059]